MEMITKTGMDLYQLRRPLLDTGDLIEWSSNSMVGRLIRWFTKKSVNHTGAAVIFPFPGIICQKVWTLEALEHGFVLNLMSRRLQGFSGEVYVLKLKHEFNTFRPRIASELLGLVGVKYDYESLFRQVAGGVSSDASKLFCSEAQDEVLRKCGLIAQDFNNGKRLRPGEFWKTGLYEEPKRIF